MLPRQLASFEHVILRLHDALTLRDVFISQRAVGEKVLGLIVLKFDGIGARSRRRVDHFLGQPHVAIMIETDFGDEETGCAFPDQMPSNGKLFS